MHYFNYSIALPTKKPRYFGSSFIHPSFNEYNKVFPYYFFSIDDSYALHRIVEN